MELSTLKVFISPKCIILLSVLSRYTAALVLAALPFASFKIFLPGKGKYRTGTTKKTWNCTKLTKWMIILKALKVLVLARGTASISPLLAPLLGESPC